MYKKKESEQETRSLSLEIIQISPVVTGRDRLSAAGCAKYGANGGWLFL